MTFRKRATLRIAICLFAVVSLIRIPGCSSGEPRPVDIFPEDNCAQCRMAVSDLRFASELITVDGEVLKFDDIGCFLKYRSTNAAISTAAMFLKTFDSKEWIPYERAVIIESGVETPMGSGKIVFSDSAAARDFQKKHPLSMSQDRSDNGCCRTRND